MVHVVTSCAGFRYPFMTPFDWEEDLVFVVWLRTFFNIFACPDAEEE